MTRNLAKVMQLTAAIRKQGATDDLLKQVVLVLADEVVHLSRELETVRSVASRAERQSRMPIYGIRR
jgi:hypothetical protein